LTQPTIEIIEAGLSAARHEVAGFIEAPAEAADVAMMLTRLDGRDFDQLYLELLRDGERSQVVLQGGLDRIAMFFVIQESETYYLRVEPDRLEGEEDAKTMITSGGSGIDVLVRWLVPINTAARGLWYYLPTGECDPGLAWEPLSGIAVDL
jgi:hypothetical protein